MKPIPPSAVRWTAWRRAGRGRWYRLGTADTESGAWALVYAALDAAPGSGDFSSVVLRDGVKP